jgi:predicted RND superfamily exporter protein
MSEGVIVAVITGLLTLVGTIITVVIGNNKSMAAMEKNQAVTDTKLDNLTEEVKRHNNFAQRIPVIETQIQNLDNRVSKLEVEHGKD